MFCPKCGKELGPADKFCKCCGAVVATAHDSTSEPEHLEGPVPMSDTPRQTEEPNVQKSRRTYHKIILAVGVVSLAIVIIRLLSPGGYDAEYSNNEDNRLPIAVTGVEVEEGALFTEPLTTFFVANREDTDYKYAQFAVLAWDTEGFPIRLDQPFVISEADYSSEYLEIFQIDNVPAQASLRYECTFNYGISEIGYMTVFLISCEDYSANAWENPIADDLKEIEGCKLKDTDLYYFEFAVQ